MKWTLPPVIGPQEIKLWRAFCYQHKSGPGERSFIRGLSMEAPNHHQKQIHALPHLSVSIGIWKH